MINNNFYYYLKDNLYINFLDYIFIYSIITIQNPKYLFIYHDNQLNGNYYNKLTNSKLWNIFGVTIFFKKINKNFNDIFINDFNTNGGIFIGSRIFMIRSIKNFLNYDIIKINNILVGTNYKYEEITNNEKKIYNIKDNLIYSIENEEIFKNIIYDYNFSNYFNIIYNFHILKIDIEYDVIINEYLLESKITIFNLIIYYILGYYYYFIDKKTIIESNNNIINTIDKIFYINLKKNIIRNENMIEIFEYLKINYNKFEGLDGSINDNLKDKFFYSTIDNYNSNSNSEYAVLYSHLSLIKKLENEEGEYFIIFEDDLCLDFNKYWKISLEEIIKQAPDDWEILMLGYFTLDLNFESNFRAWNNDWSALSYIIKKSSINKINNYIKNNKFKLFKDINVADNYIFRIFKTYLYKYPLFTISNNNKSTFHNDHDNYQKIYKNINYLILNDIFSDYIN